jgi:HK97 family phage prohead protease
MNLQHRAFSFELDEKQTDVDKLQVAGYASAFGIVDSYKERVMPGAFSDSIQRHTRGERPVKVLYQHVWDRPIGRPTLMQEDGRGLYTITQLSDTRTNREELMPLLKDGVIDRQSIGFMPVTTTWNDDEQILDLNVVDLWEYSPVTFPANWDAQITSVKTLREKAEKALGLATGDLDAEGAQYAMAVLMGARGASDFADLPTGERAQLYGTLSSTYRSFGLEPPEFVPTPRYDSIEFRHDERAIYLGRYLGKRIADVTSGVKGYQRTGRPVPANLREELSEALAQLDTCGKAASDSVDLRLRLARAEAKLGLTR